MAFCFHVLMEYGPDSAVNFGERGPALGGAYRSEVLLHWGRERHHRPGETYLMGVIKLLVHTGEMISIN